ncbi:MAG: MATE family efflux transporter [Lachnobacterium sp.]|nr:MATE family efflux transporter [Lachnobacterium sp.]
MTKDLTTGSPMKIFIMFSIPILLGNLFQQLYNMVDTIIVGQYLGEEALAAVGTTGCLMFLVLGFANGIAQGFGVMIAQAFGAGNHKQLRHFVALIVVLTILVSLILSLPTTIFSKNLLMLLNVPDNILAMADSYIKVIFAGLILTMAYNVEAGILRGVGDSKTPLYFLLLASVLNIILDFVLIVFAKMGTAGAAYATVIGQGVSAVLCFIYMHVKFPLLRLSREDFYYDWDNSKKLLSLGIPMAINYSITAIGTMILQAAINVFGSSVVASYTAASKIINLTTQAMPSLGTTSATYCGQNLGAGKYGRIYKGMRCGFVLCAIVGALGAVISLIAEPWMISMFIPNPTAEAMGYAHIYLVRACTCMIPLAWIFVYRSAMQGLNQALVPMLCGTVELVSRFLVIAIVSKPFGYSGVCWTDPVCWLVTGVMVLAAYLLWERKFKRSHVADAIK